MTEIASRTQQQLIPPGAAAGHDDLVQYTWFIGMAAGLVIYAIIGRRTAVADSGDAADEPAQQPTPAG